MRAGLCSLKPETVSWLHREMQLDELSQAGAGRGPGDRGGCRNPSEKLCAASALKSLPRLAAHLRPELLGTPRWSFKEIVDWLKQMGFREPDHSLGLCS